jgi:glucose/mannose-6-phosphate isomerase
MGGSGIGGELAQVLLNKNLNVPLLFYHNYDVPKFINNKSLVIMVSYSGNTEEVLKAYNEVKSQNGNIVIISSGGELVDRAKKDNYPFVKLPPGYQPRTAVGLLFFPIIYIISYMGLLDNQEKEFLETIETLKRIKNKYYSEIPLSSNRAKEIAQKIHGTIPIIYSSVYYLDPVAKRWKNQFNENAKIFSHYDFFPELCHNTICAWDKFIEKANYSVIILRSKKEDGNIKKRVDFLKEIIIERKVIIEEVKIDCNNILEEIMSLLYFGDFVSMYLALLRGVDPANIDLIHQLKAKL